MLVKIATVLALIAGSIAAHAESQELSKDSVGTLEILLNNLPNLKIKNDFDQENTEYPAVKEVAKSLAKASSVTGNCRYVGKSLIEECYVDIKEGTDGEGFSGSALAVIGFKSLKGKVIGNTISFLRAL
jgi:hypothetical protein